MKKVLGRLEEIENEKKALSTEINFKEDELDFIKATIYTLEDELLDLDREKQELLNKTNYIKQLEVLNNDGNLPNNDFYNKFVLASRFTPMEFDGKKRGILNKVKMEKSRMVAMDGYRFLMVNADIPKKLQNTLIAWDERVNLEYNAKNSEESIHQYFKYNDLLDSVNISNHLIKDTTISRFYDKYFLLTDNEFDVFCINTMQMAFNSDFMSDAKKVFKDDLVDIVIPDSSLNPIMIKNSEYKMIILPIRLSQQYDKYNVKIQDIQKN